MRLVFYLFIFSQLLNFVSVLADKYTKESSETKKIKWEKIQEKNSNDLKKIIWKYYKDDKSYFQNNNEESSKVKKTENYRDENIYNSKLKSNPSILEIEPYLPLNNFLDYGDFQTSVRWKSSFDGGVSGGTGQQNPSFVFDYGLSNSSLISIYFSEADDNLYNLIDGQLSNYHWQNYAFSFKKKLLEENENILGLSMVSTLEYWRQASGSENTKSIYNQENNSYGKDKFENIIGAFSLPFSKNFNDKLAVVIVPGITFLPEKLGSKGIGKNAYENNFYVGSGFVLDIAEDVDLLFSYTTPLGPGNNYFDSELKYSRKPIYSIGLGWDINPKIGIEGKLSNSYGSTPSTGLLTIPSDNKPLYSANLIYKPYGEDTLLEPLNDREKLISYGGITVNNALIPKAGTSQINLNYDSKGNLFGFYGYSLSNIFQLEFLNIGRFNDNNISTLYSTYLSENNLNYRLGGKLLIFSPQKDDLFWMTVRTSVGRNDDTNQGYLFSELINTFSLNDKLAFNLSPKYFFSGVDSFGGLGLSSYINLFDNLQLIPEINTSFKNDSDFNSSLALRYSLKPGKSIDLYYSNAVGIQDIGQILEDNEYRIGFKLNFLY
ncbi:conserved hypothetical protein [Prochlorococcus marinus subsp. pastoris str. CCMP1986]|uniref:Porin n=1 Tax=Prochlorococcus marinus subsp. pastoris (strain CCMP1986 / NIES-2087 / MED4) TaxID=59919 RepID=Q7V0U0_PROMP|nr:hypothetical protein [Prochlorococcus marinus]KGF87283.1 hypothetical protein PROCH_0871 [Prochlorococcus marinus str. EQPAC1]CAE19621.1 conserved hypothetical protein [Prochlorococcus marinus subsp. pastoris str. CCMP1986]